MKRLIYVIVFMCILAGCKAKYVYVPVETIVTEKEIVRDTVIDVQLEIIRDSVIVADTTSFLENKYALSRATFSNGHMHHTLATKDIKLPIEVQYVEKTVTIEKEVPIEVEIIKYEKKTYPFIVRFSIIFTILVLGIWLIKILK